MSTDLEAKIEGRKQEAKDKKLEWKANTVAQYLGNRQIETRPQPSRGTESGEDYKFVKGSMEINYGWHRYQYGEEMSGGSSVKIFWKGEEVFAAGGSGVTTYAPGTWEKQLNMYFSEADKKREAKIAKDRARKQEEADKKLADKKSKWGL